MRFTLALLLFAFALHALHAAQVSPDSVKRGLESDIAEAARDLAAFRDARLKANQQLKDAAAANLRAAQDARTQAAVLERQNARNLREADAADAELRNWRAREARVKDILADFTAKSHVAPDTPSSLLDSLLRDIRTAQTGTRAPSAAVAADGSTINGSLIRIGPALFYASSDGIIAAPVTAPVTGIDAGIVAGIDALAPRLPPRLKKRESAAVRELFAGRPAMVPVDVTGGRGFALRRAEEPYWHHLLKGGPVMLPIAVLALLCFVMAVWKMMSMLRLPGDRAMLTIARIAAQLASGDVSAAEALASTLRAPLKSLALSAVRSRGMTRDAVEERLFDDTLKSLPPIERYLGVLAAGASAAPLLGLLGTVTGMIHTFRLITVFGTGDARLLSAGISEALVTTEAGLLVAIPALLVHAWCVRRVRRLKALCQEAAVCLINAAGSEVGSEVGSEAGRKVDG